MSTERGLTDEDIRTLQDIATGNQKFQNRLNTPDPDSEEALSFPWRDHDGRSGVAIEQCNAVRCAAEDGLSYRRIADLFSFLCDKTHARKHAVGKCRHVSGVCPVRSNGRQPGQNTNAVSERLCSRLRRLWGREYFETYREAGEWAGFANASTAWKHINGECSHRQEGSR